MHVLELVAVLLFTAVVAVPIFQKLGLGAVLGYLAAGMFIGPWGLGIVADVESTLGFAEFGVVLLLFLIGLELEPARLWALRKSVFGLGAAQVVATGLLLGVAVSLLGLGWQAALIAGLGLAMSSTALVISALSERGQLAARHGRDAFAVLLFQDLAVIPLIALLPLFGAGGAHAPADGMAAIKGIAAILLVVAGSRVVVRPALKLLAQHSSREVFTAAALLLVVGAALLMEQLGLSMSLGAFLAGMLLADSEFRHELEADIEPFKGLLLGLFFMTVGMSANLDLVRDTPLKVVLLATGLIAVKAAVLYGIARAFRAPPDSSQRLSIALAQGGEFAFVLFAAAQALGIFTRATADLLVIVVTVSMLFAPLLIAGHDRWLTRRLEANREPEYDEIDAPATPVIIAGYGRFGQIVSRVLRMCGIPFTALEINFQQVDFVRRFGNRIYYGDASRPDLLAAAKTGEARLFVLAIDDVDASVKTAMAVRRHYPNLPILARARNRVHYFRLRDLGIPVIRRETFPASLDVAHQALLRLGIGVTAAERAVSMFRQHDEAQLDAQYALRHDEERLIQTTREAADQLRDLFESDMSGPGILSGDRPATAKPEAGAPPVA